MIEGVQKSYLDLEAHFEVWSHSAAPPPPLCPQFSPLPQFIPLTFRVLFFQPLPFITPSRPCTFLFRPTFHDAWRSSYALNVISGCLDLAWLCVPYASVLAPSPQYICKLRKALLGHVAFPPSQQPLVPAFRAATRVAVRHASLSGLPLSSADSLWKEVRQGLADQCHSEPVQCPPQRGGGERRRCPFRSRRLLQGVGRVHARNPQC